jgi:hypothetical protein
MKRASRFRLRRRASLARHLRGEWDDNCMATAYEPTPVPLQLIASTCIAQNDCWRGLYIRDDKKPALLCFRRTLNRSCRRCSACESVLYL